MKTTLSIIVAAAASPALAHTGHVAQQDGHSHWLTAGIFAAAAVVAVAAILRSRRKKTGRRV